MCCCSCAVNLAGTASLGGRTWGFPASPTDSYGKKLILARGTVCSDVGGMLCDVAVVDVVVLVRIRYRHAGSRTCEEATMTCLPLIENDIVQDVESVFAPKTSL